MNIEFINGSDKVLKTLQSESDSTLYIRIDLEGFS